MEICTHATDHILNARYVFNDGLLYEDRNWQYVSQGDRRFYTEVKEGALAEGKEMGKVMGYDGDILGMTGAGSSTVECDPKEVGI